MAPLKCCVGGCDATSKTHRLYCLPSNDYLRNLWMSFLVPTNSRLLFLSKDQLLSRRVCQKHFDRTQFDQEGKRLRFSYPCLFTEDEIARGEPLPAAGVAVNILSEHNYCKEQDDVDETLLVIGRAGENFYEHPSCSQSKAGASVTDKNDITFEQPSCSQSKATSSITDKNDITFEQPSCSSTKDVESLSTNIVETVTKPKPEVQVPSNQKYKDTCLTPHPTAFAPPSPPHLCTRTVKGSSHKKFGSKQRQFMKNVKKMATDSLGLTASERFAQAQSCASNQRLFENFFHLSKQGQTFLLMQLRESRKNKMARRFTLEEKLMALLMMKQSPKEYKLLETMFALPNKRTLHRLSEKVIVAPGLNPQVFDYIKKKTKNWETKQKLCTIVFDEVSLTPHLTYDEKDDQINGFVDVAGERKLKFCDHALVFMLRGICSPWRQSVAYYFCEGTVSTPALQNILKQIVSQVAQTGLTPLGLVCDQGSTFRTAIKKMRDETLRLRNIQGLRDDGSVNIAGHDLNVFFDSPHLLKGLRNNFLNKNIIWEGKRASWADIQFIYDLDSKLGHTRTLPKLTEQHVNPDKIKKMKVSVAAKVFSARTAAMLKYTGALNSLHGKSTSMETTAEVVEFFDTLFDSVNGYPGGAKRGKMRKAVKKNSEHVSFWTDAIQKLKKFKFEDCSSKVAVRSGKPRLVRVPSLEGWITTLESFKRLTKLLFEKYSVDYYYPRCINQDPLENFFGRIRALNYRNINPNASTFVHAFKSLFFTNILSPHSKFANCEADQGETLIDVGFLFEEQKDKENQPPNLRSLPSVAQEHPPLPSSASLNKDEVIIEKIKVQCSAYTAGYVCRKLTKYIKCKSCLETYTSSSVEGIHAYIKYREYKNLKNDNLVYPNEKVLRAYRDVSQYVHEYLNKNCHKSMILKNIEENVLSTCRFSWLGCSIHSSLMKFYLVKSIIKLQIHNWCNGINKILKAGMGHKYVSIMEPVQKLALEKYKSLYSKKKALNK